MISEVSAAAHHDDAELEAYNAAFYELGFRWHWSEETYSILLRNGNCAASRIRHYLETHQSHLLKAYDANFLAEVIHQKQNEHREREAALASRRPNRFDWSQTLGGELGA